MSVPIIRATLSVGTKRDVAEELRMVKIVKMIRKPGNGGRLEPAHAPEPPIIFFRLQEGIVELPYHFARSRHLGRWSEDPVVASQHASLDDVLNKSVGGPAHLSAESRWTGELRDYQRAILPELEGQLADHGTTTLGVYPGFGKTAVSAYQIARLGFRAVVVLHRAVLLGSWALTFSSMTNLRVAQWTAATARKPYPKDCDVLLCMDTCVHKIPPEERRRFGTLVMDEAHLLCTESRRDLFFDFGAVEYIIMCTATLARPDGMHSMVVQTVGQHGIFLGNPVDFDLIRVRTTFSPDIDGGRAIMSAKGLDSADTASVWLAILYSLAFDEERNAFLADLVACRLKDRKVIVLTFLAEHIEKLVPALAAAGETDVATLYRSQNTYEDARVLIGTASKISVGFDPNGTCVNWGGRKFDALVLCTSIAGLAPMIQTFGRCFRADHPVIYYINDRHGIIDNHWKGAVAYAEGNHGTVVPWKAEATS